MVDEDTRKNNGKQAVESTRLICLRTTEAGGNICNAAMEALLHPPPLHLHLQREKLHIAIRLPQITNFKPDDWQEHFEILPQSL